MKAKDILIGNDVIDEEDRPKVAVGVKAFVRGSGAIAIGPFSCADGEGAIAVGFRACAMGRGAVAIGDCMFANGDGVVKIGEAGTLFSPEHVAALRKSIQEAFRDGFQVSEDIFLKNHLDKLSDEEARKLYLLLRGRLY